MEAGTPLSPGGASADSLEFVSSPYSQHDDPIVQQKKASPDNANGWDGGWAKKGWSRSLNDFSKNTLANTYLDGHPTPFQRRQLCECYAEISKFFDNLEGKELHEQVADLFNRQQDVEFSEYQCGYIWWTDSRKACCWIPRGSRFGLDAGSSRGSTISASSSPHSTYFYRC
jgi:hypothetical protein